MKKETFINLLFSIIGGLFFALGMCMCLIEEWKSFTAGIVFCVIGIIILISLLIIRFRIHGKPSINIPPRTIGLIAMGTAGTLLLGLGMSIVMVWENLLIWGIIVGIAGIATLICLIPVWKGLK